MVRSLAVGGCLLAGLVGCGSGAPPAARNLIDIDANGNLNPSPRFRPTGRWVIDYSWDCSTQISQGHTNAGRFAMVILNADDDSANAEHADLNRLGKKGTGTLAFKRAGQYYLQIISDCSYRIKVVDTRA